MRATRAVIALAVVVAALGCDAIKSLSKHVDDPIVGSWRMVSAPGSGHAETMTFERDGTFRLKFGQVDPAVVGEDIAKFLRGLERVPARYSRSDDLIVISQDVKAIRKATAHMPLRDPDKFKGEVFDQVYSYKLSGDVLETTSKDDKGETLRYVRVR